MSMHLARPARRLQRVHLHRQRRPQTAGAHNDVGRMVAYKAMCDLLWTLWGVLQHANGNPAEDFWAYAVGRFERCQKLMSSSAYAVHVANINRRQPTPE